MVPWDLYDRPVGARRRHPERVVLTLNDQHGHPDRLELGQPALGWIVSAARRMKRERQAQDSRHTCLAGGAAGHACPRRTAPSHQRELTQRPLAQPREHRQPGGVELPSGRRRASSGHPVGLFDQNDGEIERAPGISCGHEVRRTDAAARPVPEGERCHRSCDLLHVEPRRPVGRCDFEHSQSSVAA